MRKIQRYGWKRDLPDHRDRKFSVHRKLLDTLPSSVDLRPQCPPVYDQGQLGCCTSAAISGMAEFLMMKQGAKDIYQPSMLAIYYWEREMEGTVNQDAGAAIRDGMNVVSNIGVPHSSLWWFNISKFAVKPNHKYVYADAAKHKVSNYLSLDNTNLTELKSCLAEGYAFVGGFTVYESFESDAVAQTGVVPMPSPNESILGGHAVMICGYDDATQRFTVRNSWGDWGQKGYFTIPYQYLSNVDLADDFWVAHNIVDA